jgi:hypothetical protein
MSTIHLGIFFLQKDFNEDVCVVVAMAMAAFGRNALVSSDTGTFLFCSPTNHTNAEHTKRNEKNSNVSYFYSINITSAQT